MPVTRSRSKGATGGADQQPVPKPHTSGRKRKATSDEVVEPVVEKPTAQKRALTGKQPVSAANAQSVETVAVPDDPGPPPVLVPAELSFSFEEAKQHLVAADSRFQDVFDTVICHPYQKLDRVEPFRRVPLACTIRTSSKTDPCRTLCTSIL
jgi:DNA-3-methyladenine glycosylase II